GEAIFDRQDVRARMTTQQSADAVVRVQIAVREPATVVVDEERMRSARLSRYVVTCGDGQSGVKPKVMDHAHGSWRARIHGSQTSPRLPRLGRRDRLRLGLATALEQGQRQLYLRQESVAVKLHRGLAG